MKLENAAALLLTITLAAALAVRVVAIQGSLPYPGHLDEPQLTTPALHMLQTGDLNPHMFEYPTLPVYLIAAGFTVGYLETGLHGVADVGAMDFPYYRTRRVVRPAKLLFAALSVLAMLFTGCLGWWATRDPRALLGAPLVLSASPFFLHESWKYLNVDIVGCAFAIATVAFVTRRRESHTALERAVIPGVLAGLTVGCKYNLLPIVAPCILSIWFWSGEAKLRHLVLFGAVCVLSFLAAVPFAIFDTWRFLDDVRAAIHHYATGHPGFEAAPGLEQLRYYARILVDDLGWLAPWLAITGAIIIARADARLATVLAAFPIALLLLMIAQRVHFARNALAVLPFYAVLATLGMIAASDAVRRALRRLPGLRDRDAFTSGAAGVLIIGAFAASLPWHHLVQAYGVRPDSRNLARRWIEAHLAPGSRLMVARELGMDTGALRARYTVDERWFRKVDTERIPDGAAAYWLVPRFAVEPRRAARGRDAFTASFAEGRFEVLERFGSAPVWVNYQESVPAGDPAFILGRLRR